MSEFVTRVPAADAGEIRRRLHRPAEGWTAVVLAALTVLIMAWAVDDPAWVNGREELTDGLLAMALMGFAFGALGPKVGWGRWTTHGIGAVFAGLLIPIMAGWAMVPGTSPWTAFQIAAEGSAEAYLDIVWRGLQYTSQEVHYIVVLGSLLWGTAQFLGYAVFGHHKALNGVVVVGVVIVVNMALTSRNQLPFLILFTVASLFLLITMHAFDERSTWVRRRIGDPSSLASMYLKGGTVFIALAITGSLLLTTRAASAPLAGAWDGIDDQLISFGEKFARLFPVGPDVRGGGGVTFGSSAVIRPSWFRGEGTAFTARIDATMPEVRWRAATYDTFALRAWVQTGVTSVPVEAGAALLAGTPEEPSANLSVPFTTTIETDEYKDSLALAPGTPVGVDRFANVLLQGDERSFAGVDLPGGRGAYTITGAVLNLADEEAPAGGDVDGITGNQLDAASTEYPVEIAARYTDVPDGAMGPEANRLLATILASAPDRNPYTLAEVMEDYLRSDAFQYSVDGTGPCDGSAVECFAATRRGYCLHYASTMAILLRAASPDNRIPTRLVQGFLPGTRDATSLVETVEAQAAHAWVEVYFPGYGWIPFDPTGGGIGRQTVIPAGPAVEPAAPTPVGSRLPDEPLPTRGAGGLTPGEEAVPTAASQPLDRIVLIILAVLLAVVVGALAIASWMRGPRSEISPDAAWTTMLQAASRFGFGPRPTQTVYEYAGSLAELVPVAREDLQTVADAKVETQYAKVRLGGERLEAVRDATRRLRISLLRLAFRRPRRRRRR
jgi:transglutaminase-like putative cysteine protease